MFESKCKYEMGDAAIFEMIENGTFDKDTADRALANIDVNIPVGKKYSFGTVGTTYLREAVICNHLQMVKYLFEHGADPNFCDPDLDAPLWDLQYIEEDQDPAIRYEIEKEFFKNGANPNLICDEVDGESLYDHVLYKVYNDSSSGNKLENLLQFYKLLVLYGGGGVCYHKPELTDIDLSAVDNYHLQFYLDDDNIHIGGFLVDSEGNKHGHL